MNIESFSEKADAVDSGKRYRLPVSLTWNKDDADVFVAKYGIVETVKHIREFLDRQSDKAGETLIELLNGKG